MRVVPDNAHCLEHACSYPLDRECPHCQVERLTKQLIREAYPHICPVCTPELYKELEKLK